MAEDEGVPALPREPGAAPRPPARLAKHALLLLKAGNLGLITFYSFAIIYVLVRVIDPAFYPWIVFITSIGNYILASDLGFGGYVYASLRKSFLHGELAARTRFVSDALNAYFAIALGSAGMAAVAIVALLHVAPAMKLAIALYFGAIVLSLPWSLFRRINAAIDRFVAMEVLEMARRLATVLLAGSMLLGVSFLAFAVLSLVLWAVSFAAALLLLRRQGIAFTLVPPGEALRFIGDNRSHVYSTAKLTGFEFAIYNHPYLVLPFVTGSAGTIVAYDIFYKFVRFGGVAYSVAVETFLPYQTRAFYAGDRAGVRRYQGIMIALGLIPFAIGSLFLLVLGQQFMVGLLSAAHPIEPALRYLIIAMLGAILFQTTAGSLLVGIGEYNRLGNLSSITVAIMAASAVATWVLHLPFMAFMAAYVAAYAVHACLFQGAFARTIGRPTRNALA